MAKKESIFASIKEFEKAVSVTKRLIADKIARVRLLGNQMVNISLDEQSFEKKEIQEIEKDTLKRLLNSEIPAVITASLQKRPRSILSMLLPGDTYEKKEIREEFDKKIKLVEQALITPQLRQRTLLKEISKNDVLDELKWDIGYKCHDLEKGSIVHLQFATLQLVCNGGSLRSRLFSPFNPFGTGREHKTLTIDMHLEDLEQLIDDLSVLRDNLKKDLKG